MGKYLLYAIGEILIVIIGILMAVRVDAWNKSQADRVTEISILKSLKAELEEDLVALRGFDLPLLNEVLKSSDILIHHLEADLPYHDSLAYHFITSHSTTHIIYNKGAISNLRSTGVNIITNEEIRNQIINLYDVKFDFLDYLGLEQNNYRTHGQNFIMNGRFDQNNFWDDPTTKDDLFDGAMVPLDYEALKEDMEYMYYLKSYKNLTGYYLYEFSDTEKTIEQVISALGEEIVRLEK
jgi:hypothetical protein